ncbi:MAG: hypothetical protein KDJ38_18510 [Gammaproteobacteria bacterium]|nr:hypothetical protein [Gammaproteobacteria bacterium]
MTIPKFCALCVDDEDDITNCGTGDTPDAALADYLDNGDFESHCDYCCFASGDDVEIYIYSVVSVEDSDWSMDEADPKWTWCLDRKVDTRIVKAV